MAKNSKRESVMDSHAEQERVEQVAPQGERVGGVLQEIQDEYQTGEPWQQRILSFLAWSGGVAGATGLALMLLLLIVELFTAGRQFTARALSDWFFWGAALLLLAGLLAPSASEVQESSRQRSSRGRQRSATQRSTGEKMPQRPFQSRRDRAMRRRLLRVYNPWRWRLWASALLCFALSMIAGLWA
jgi:hypothetical protein